MSIRKYRDWRGWLDGLRSKAMQAGAESVATNLAAMLGTNGLASMVPSLHDFALTWKAALFTTGFQFLVRAGTAAAKYVAEKPDPDMITEETNSNPTAFTKTEPPKTP